MKSLKADVLVIGGGPGGYVTALRAGQLGLTTVLVEEAALGGTCLNLGCISSKSLIHVAETYYEARSHEQAAQFGVRVSQASLDFSATMRWKDSVITRLTSGIAGLLKKQKVIVLRGTATIEDGKTCTVSGENGPMKVAAEHLVIATGSTPLELNDLRFGDPVISSAQALALEYVPTCLAVIGAGYIGIELGTAFAKFGSAVTIVESADSILPGWDGDLTKPVARRLESLGVNVLTRAVARGLSADRTQLQVECGTPQNKIMALACDKILLAVGRQPRTKGFGLDRLDLDMEDGFVRIDTQCATSMRNVWGIGDVAGSPMLAHRAMAQGKMVAELIAGQRMAFDQIAVPAICFSDPEIVVVGLSPKDAGASERPLAVSSFPFIANGRALTQGDEVGFIRVVARADTHQILGVQAVGRQVSELASTFALAIEMGAVVEDIVGTVQAHPTRGEAFYEAALGALGQGLHL
jgi:dihydrolipoamide dehydrogenase